MINDWYPRQCPAYVVDLSELLRYAGQAGVLGNNGVRQRTQSENNGIFYFFVYFRQIFYLKNWFSCPSPWRRGLT
jgi:hypothetical protein